MKKRAVWFLPLVVVLFLAPTWGAGQAGGGYDYSLIDQHALSAPAEVERSVSTLARYLVAPARNDREKARAIFRWITDRIAYDADLYLSGRTTLAQVSPEDVLRTRKSICAGYARLFLALAKEAGLSAVKISGYAKGYSYTPGRIEFKENHDWNAVQLDGSWYLLDSTWGAGSVSAKGFHKQFEPYYFLTPPQKLIWSHFPTDSRWQLLNPPISREEFFRRVALKAPFFNYGLQLESHTDAVIAAEDRLTVSLLSPPQVSLIAKLVSKDHNQVMADWPLTMAERKGSRVLLHAVFPRAGGYVLQIYAGTGQGYSEWVMEYHVQAQASAGEDAGFPFISPQFQELGLALDSHHKPLIRAGSELTISLLAPPEVLVLANLVQEGRALRESLVQTERRGEKIIIKVQFPAPGTYILNIFAKRSTDPGGYPFVLKYWIIASQGAGETAGWPKTSVAFSTLGLKLVSPTQPVVKTSQELAITLVAARDVFFLASLEQERRELQGSYTLVQRKGEQALILVRFPAAGKYQVNVFARRGNHVGSFDWVLGYEVIAQTGAGENAQFPRTSPLFALYELGLVSHQSLVIPAGSEFTLTLHAPSQVKLLPDLSQNNRSLSRDLISMSRRGEEVSFHVRLPAAGRYKLMIYAKLETDPGLSYDYVMEYEVDARG